MRIDSKGQIAGVPVLVVRDYLRRMIPFRLSAHSIASDLKLSGPRAEELVSHLLRLGYVDPIDTLDGEQHYKITLSGSTFTLASAAPPLTRRTAERKLAEFLERVRSVNDNPDFVFRIQKVLLFGSYLTEQDRINDIDVAVELVHRETNPDKIAAAKQARVKEARKAGRRFSTLVDELIWPHQEVLLFLKSRSRAISLHLSDDGILKETQSLVIFQDGTKNDCVTSE
jgi:hypothetical protein